MSHVMRRRTPVLLWPFVLLWWIVTFVANLTGILLAIVLGLAFMGLGVAFTLTFIGAIVGIPLFILGLMLLIRGLY